MATTPAIEPMLPSQCTDLEDLAVAVYKASAKPSGRVHPVTGEKLVLLLRNINSYYSNLIEGIRTTLVDIEEGLHKLSPDENVGRLQLLHRLNIRAQESHAGQCVRSEEITSEAFLCKLHLLLFDGAPEVFLTQQDDGGKRVLMVPGTLRRHNVRIGTHQPPSPEQLPQLLNRFERAYSLQSLRGTTRLIAAAASHHRLLWIHPFLEGNGRVTRLFTDVYLTCSGLEGYGLWTINRGFARHESDYKAALSAADAKRQSDYDGCGNLSEKALHKFCRFFLETALDQAAFMDGLLQLDSVEKNIELYCALRTQGRVHGKPPLPKEAAAILKYVFIHGTLIKGDVHKLINVSDRKARDVVKALLQEGLLETANQKAPLTIGFPAEAVRFYFPDLCDAGAF